ncbi:MAG: amidohydrolase [Planctomycetes bacterium]|nr:amidohydrolase [Planctomycetota bacterium]
MPKGMFRADNHGPMKPANRHPDLLIRARRCYSLRAGRRAVEALAIEGGRIIGLGSWRAISRLKGRATRRVDLGDGAVTSGLVDCHAHFFYWALHRALTISVSECRSLAETLARIRRQARRRSVGDWIVALGFDYNPWPEGRPSAPDLDQVSPSRPAVVLSRDVHTAWLNSAALRRLGITARTPDPKGGRFLRDSRGRPTGIVQEAAVDLLPDPVWEFAERADAAAVRAIDHALEQAYRVAWSHGIVGVHAADGAASLTHLQRQHRERRLGIRVVHAIPLANLPHAKELGLRTGLGDQWLRLGAVKVFADGALGSQTAYMFRPYPDSGGHCGVAVTAGRELCEVAVDAARSGWALWIHAIGDRAVHEAIAAIAAARRVERTPLVHRIEHVQCARPADIGRMARLGIVASVQPAHIMGDIRTAQRHWPRASRNAYAFRSMVEAGVTLAMGSDVPVESIDPRRSLFGAVTRTDEQGNPKGGWYPGQRLSVRQVLQGFTSGAAAAVGGPPLAGTLAPGAPADLTLWHDDPLAARPEELLNLRVAGCVVDGQLHLND